MILFDWVYCRQCPNLKSLPTHAKQARFPWQRYPYITAAQLQVYKQIIFKWFRYRRRTRRQNNNSEFNFFLLGHVYMWKPKQLSTSSRLHCGKRIFLLKRKKYRAETCQSSNAAFYHSLHSLSVTQKQIQTFSLCLLSCHYTHSTIAERIRGCEKYKGFIMCYVTTWHVYYRHVIVSRATTTSLPVYESTLE